MKALTVKKHGGISDSRTDAIFGVINGFFISLIVLVMLYPLYFIIIASISDPYAVAKGQVFLWPSGFTLGAYKEVFKNDSIWMGYKNSIIYTAFGTLLNLVLCIPAAYALSNKKLPVRPFFTWFFVFTMYFNGGMIPTYLLVKNLGLINQPFTLIVLNGVNVYNIIVLRSFFQNSIPADLYEAATIDGASSARQFFQIALPLAKPIIAVVALYFGVTRWNSYFTPLLYVTKPELAPLQLVLRNILITNQQAMSIDMGTLSSTELDAVMYQAYMAEAMKYALIFISSAPLLAAYPFVQKHFTKGVMVGAVKG